MLLRCGWCRLLGRCRSALRAVGQSGRWPLTCHHAVQEEAHEVGPVLRGGRLEDAGYGLLVGDGMHQSGVARCGCFGLLHSLRTGPQCPDLVLDAERMHCVEESIDAREFLATEQGTCDPACHLGMQGSADTAIRSHAHPWKLSPPKMLQKYHRT